MTATGAAIPPGSWQPLKIQRTPVESKARQNTTQTKQIKTKHKHKQKIITNVTKVGKWGMGWGIAVFDIII